MKVYNQESLNDITNRISYLKQLEEGVNKITSGNSSEVKDGICSVLKKTVEANDEMIHIKLRQTLLAGEDPAAAFADLKALESARICCKDLLSEITNPQATLDSISDKLSNLVARKKEIEENLKQQENA